MLTTQQPDHIHHHNHHIALGLGLGLGLPALLLFWIFVVMKVVRARQSAAMPPPSDPSQPEWVGPVSQAESPYVEKSAPQAPYPCGDAKVHDPIAELEGTSVARDVFEKGDDVLVK